MSRKPSTLRTHDLQVYLQDNKRGRLIKVRVKMVRDRLNQWNVPKRNQKGSEKEDLCRKLLEDLNRGLQPSLDPDRARKLRRWIKAKPATQDSDQLLANLLPRLTVNASSSNESKNTPLSTIEDEDDQWLFVDDTNGHINSVTGNNQVITGIAAFFSRNGNQNLTQSVWGDTDEDSSNKASNDESATIGAPIIRQPTPAHRTMECLLGMSQQYYHSRLQNYTAETSEPGLMIDTGAATNRVFWNHIKSGIYFLKMRSPHLANQELAPAIQMIPELCSSEPFALLKEFYSTLSPINTSVYPCLRTDLLRAFWSSAAPELGRDHFFTQICRLLSTEEASDELSLAAMQAMLDETCPQAHALPENFELQHAMIQLYRRKGAYESAEEMVIRLIAAAKHYETRHGLPATESTFAFTESVHIDIDRGQFERALATASAVVTGWKNCLGDEYPDERAIYAMEDVAEVCKKLDRGRDCIAWLTEALQAAVLVWGDVASTQHIHEKLQLAHEKEELEINCPLYI